MCMRHRPSGCESDEKGRKSMKRLREYWPVLCCIVVVLNSEAEITNAAKPIRNDPWRADSLFLGAEIVAASSSQDVVVRWLNSESTNALGELYFVPPDSGDSAVFLFHNLQDRFPEESTEVNLGVFPASTPLVFMYVVVDANEKYDSIVGKKLYFGQNRPGVDEYVSEKVHGDKRRWCVVGTVDSSTVEAGFEDYIHTRYKSIIFEVQGARLGSE